MRRALQSLLGAAGLFILAGAAFFAPWMQISCDPKSMLVNEFQSDNEQVSQALRTRRVVARASGWDLATGRLEADPELARYKQVDSGRIENGSIAPRYWLFAGLAVPIAGVVICLLALTGNARIDTCGFGLKVLAIFGLLIAASVVTDDLIFETQPVVSEMLRHQADVAWLTPGQQAWAAELRGASQRWQEGATAEPTAWLLAIFPLYVFVGLIGFVCTRLPEHLCRYHRDGCQPLARVDKTAKRRPAQGPKGKPRSVIQHLGGESLFDPDGTDNMPASRESWSTLQADEQEETTPADQTMIIQPPDEK
ncbi:MAG: hypothetical protein ACOCZE_00955 [Planctomycetota bacterium]